MPPRPSMISGSRLRVVTKLSDSGAEATLELADRMVCFVERLGIAMSGRTALYHQRSRSTRDRPVGER